MKLVSSQTEQKVRAAAAKEQFALRLQELAANIIRVARGAGRAYEVPLQIFRCAELLQEYREASGFGLSDQEVSSMLGVRQDHYSPGQDWFAAATADAAERIMRGGLQVAASRLVEQRTQERAGRNEMLDGARALENAKAERRNEMPPPSRANEREARAQIRKLMVEMAAEGAQPPPAPRKKVPEKSADSARKPPTPAPVSKEAKSAKRAGRKAVLAAYKAKRGIEQSDT
jgi:hypothetical protein